ncbi:LysE family translocator [Celerinatantimonas diazotrophica]|uniref:Threonine/homoserine/homoserine lactone efflux protein n=1 Tax=Celerinatantimonas diazotrophica TaxID=412034 RepID=A0A4R1J7X6_9GAMM|nr:LysE family transporter [Celerinatantimonas diazotrophica]TCK46653.1 threonine/homoserine/homoserine lactone efflux protein [Celerinatantimonas diazotrophica]CAG9295355.1 Threonine efflux protein [Celerinatantimonas diazotrophica]
MADIWSLISIGFAFFFVAVSPGPATISNATIAMRKGRKVSLVYGAGLSMGLLLWGVVAASGFGVILQGSVYLLMLLKIIGGIYLLWLAYLSFKSSFNSKVTILQSEAKETSYFKWFMRGFILNSSNPKTIIAWMVALSVGMGASSDVFFLISAVFVCMLVGFLVNALYSVLFSLDGVMNAYQKIGHWVDRFASGMFTLSGLGLLWSAFSRNSA